MNIVKGFVAGFAATVALSVLMILKSMMGLMPNLDVVGMLGTMSGGGVTMGWIGHFVIGTVVWGGLFALGNEYVPGQSQLIKGVWFGTGAWLLMMLFVMPMAGAGIFGMNFGIMAPVMTLVLHWVFGAVLGLVYQAEVPSHEGGKHA